MHWEIKKIIWLALCNIHFIAGVWNQPTVFPKYGCTLLTNFSAFGFSPLNPVVTFIGHHSKTEGTLCYSKTSIVLHFQQPKKIEISRMILLIKTVKKDGYKCIFQVYFTTLQKKQEDKEFTKNWNKVEMTAGDMRSDYLKLSFTLRAFVKPWWIFHFNGFKGKTNKR